MGVNDVQVILVHEQGPAGASDAGVLTDDVKAALNAANSPTEINPIATLNDIAEAGGGDMMRGTYDPDGDGKVLSAVDADKVPWSGVQNPPSTYPPDTHDHNDVYEPKQTAATQTDAETIAPPGSGIKSWSPTRLFQAIAAKVNSMFTNKAALDKITADVSGAPKWNNNPWPGAAPTNKTALDKIGEAGANPTWNGGTWPGSTGGGVQLGTSSTTAFRGDYGQTAYTHATATGHAPATAQKNVQADWTQTITSDDSYIKGKPPLGTAAAKNVGTGPTEVSAGNHGHTAATITGYDAAFPNSKYTFIAPPFPTQDQYNAVIARGFLPERIGVDYVSDEEMLVADYDALLGMGILPWMINWIDISAFSGSAPVTGSISIDNGAQYSNTGIVELKFTTNRATQVLISPIANFQNAVWDIYPIGGVLIGYTLPTGDGSKTIYAKFRDDANVESISYSATIIRDIGAPALTVTPADGAYTSVQSVVMTATDAVSGPLGIFYTTDGTTPTYPMTGTTQQYAGPITVGAAMTVKAIARDLAGNSSAVITRVYTVTVSESTPPVLTFTPDAGTFTSAQSVVLSAADPGSGVYGIFFTTDGSTPTYPMTGTTQSYSAPIAVNSDMTIKAFARDNAGNLSAVASKFYDINAVQPPAPTGFAANTHLEAGTGFTLNWTV